jgi:hypothetical protein
MNNLTQFFSPKTKYFLYIRCILSSNLERSDLRFLKSKDQFLSKEICESI